MIDDMSPAKIIIKFLEDDKISEANDIMKTEKINEKKFNIMRVFNKYI